jgi:zinc protease
MYMMSRILLVSCLVALLAAPVHGASAKPVKPQKLANGLTLVLEPDPRAGGVDVTVWYRAGTMRESAGRTGLTHLIEQLMFRGPAAGEDYLRRIQRLGGSAGTESAPDYTSFFQTVPPEALGDVLQMEADRMQALPATAADFAAVQQLVRQNRARAGNTPIGRGFQHLLVGAFEGHPYAWPAIGREEDLAAITLEDCVAFHRDHYGPGNAIVTVTGRFDPSEAAALVKRTLGRVAKRPPPKPASVRLPAPVARRIDGTYAFAGPSVLIGWRVPAAGADDAVALEILARGLAGYPQAPLDRNLLGESRPSAYVASNVELRHDAGLFFTVAALRAGSDSTALREVERTLRGEIARVAREGLPEHEIARARRSAQVSRLFGMQRSRDRAAAIGKGQMLAGDFAASEKTLARLAALTPADIRAVAERWLAGGTPVTVWMMPEGGAR